MINLNWLVEHRFESLTKNDFSWDFRFSDGVLLRAECPWRLVDWKRIVVTSEDHEQKFGLPNPINSCSEVDSRISETSVTTASVRKRTLDLSLEFRNGFTLELLPISSGYEAWQLIGNGKSIIACGGGELAIFPHQP